MSLRAILEVVVHLDSFRNIDLFFQGLYYVRVSIFNKKNDEVFPITLNTLSTALLCEPLLYLHLEAPRRETKENEKS